jgi:hypothetical protein
MNRRKVGDASPPLIAVLMTEAGYDLTDKTVEFFLYRPDGTTISRACTVVDGASNIVQFDFLGTDFNEAGRFYGEFIATTSGGLERSFPPSKDLNFDVEDHYTP